MPIRYWGLWSIYIYICIYIYIYIYIYLSIDKYIDSYIAIYIYICICIGKSLYIYIYVYIYSILLSSILSNQRLSPLDVDLTGCFYGASCQWVGGRCANKTVERKAPKRCTFSPDDPKTSMEFNCSVEMRIAKGAFSIRSLVGEFLLLGK